MMPATRRIEIRTMPADLLRRIDRAAAADRRSRSQWIVRMCERALEGAMTTTERAYHITNTASGLAMGIYVAASPEAAVRAMTVDAGYPDGQIPAEIESADLDVQQVRHQGVTDAEIVAWVQGAGPSPEALQRERGITA